MFLATFSVIIFKRIVKWVSLLPTYCILRKLHSSNYITCVLAVDPMEDFKCAFAFTIFKGHSRHDLRIAKPSCVFLSRPKKLHSLH